MSDSGQRPPGRVGAAYLLAIGAVLAALAVRWALAQALGTESPLLIFTLAVFAAAYAGGTGPGLMATVLSLLLGRYYFIEPVGTIWPTEATQSVQMAIFGAIGVAVSIMAGVARRNLAIRQQAEQSVDESRRRVSGIVESAMDAIISIDEEQRIVLFNKAAERMFRCRAEDAIGSSLDRFIPQRFRGRHRHHVEQFGQTGQTSRAMGHLQPLSALRTDGEEFPIEASISQVEISGRRVFTVVLRDITERKRAEEELRRSESQFRQLADSMPQIVWAARPDGTVDYCNRRWHEVAGLPERECSHDSFQGLLHPDDRQRSMDLWHESVTSGQPFQIEYRFKFPQFDGYRWHLGRALAVRNEAGEVVRWYGTCTDIHDLKVAVEQLGKATREAEAANAAKDHFLAVLSHELRTPLTPVIAALSVLDGETNVPESVREELAMVQRNVELEARLIDDLLDLTRITRGKVTLDRRSVQVSTMLEHVVSICSGDIQARGIHVGLQIRSRGSCVEGDPARLQQVFWNVLKNAIKFTPADGCIGIQQWNEDNHVMVEVIDSGVGIEPHVLPRIFDAFEQGEKAITREFGGLGLGLAICKTLVEMHGGAISASSDGKGKGAMFRVTLPAARCAPQSVPEKSRPKQIRPGHQPLKVLLVEDHGDTARIMKRLLSAHGHKVEVAADVASALALVGKDEFDILVSDLGLPDRSGLDLVREVRQSKRWLPAIAMSGFGQDEDIRKSHEAGFAEHLTKPIDVHRLEEAIERVVRQSNPDAP